MKTTANAAAVLAASLALTGCGDENVKPAAAGNSVRPVYQAANCGRTEPASRLTWIRNQAELEEIYRRVRAGMLGGSQPPVPQVDFAAEALVLIELGQRPTAGYQLRLASERLVLDKGDGLITFSVSEPGAYAAQVVTSPCLLVAVPRGEYATVRALSTDNRIRLQAGAP